MSRQKLLINGALMLALGNLVSALVLLARNIIAARVMGVADFGVASTLAITMALIEMLSDVGLNRLIVQAKDGEGEGLQRALHGIQGLRGVVASLAMFAVAVPYADLIGAPQAAWGYQVLAIVPLLRGLGHLDMFRLQREMRFAPFIAATLAPQVISTALIWPLAALLHDWRTMLAVILCQQVLLLAATHLVAKRPYRLRWDREAFRRSMSFGFPLLLNGALLFAIFNGDRLIVGRELGMAALGSFSVAFMLTLTPTTVMARTLQSFFLPILSRAQDEPQRFKTIAWVATETVMLAGLATAVGFALLGPPLLLALFGERYAPALGLLAPLAVMQGMRVAKGGPAFIALAQAETTNPLYANLIRVALLPVAYLMLRGGADILAIVWIALAGEIMGFFVALALLRWRIGLSLRGLIPAVLFSMLLLAAVVADALAFPPAPIGLLGNFHLAQIGLLAGFLAFPLAMPNLRRWALHRFFGK